MIANVSQREPGRFYGYAEHLWSIVGSGTFAQLGNAAARVWVVLFKHADAGSMTCDPSLATIARLAGRCRSTVTRGLAELEDKKIIRREPGGGKLRTVYELLPVAPVQQVDSAAAPQPRNSPRRTDVPGPVASVQQPLLHRRAQNHNHATTPGNRNHRTTGSGNGACAKQGGKWLVNVSADELQDNARLLRRFDEAVRLGMVERSECGQLSFFALAEHAVRVADKNPAGLFSANVAARRWAHATGVDEDRASRRLAEMRENGDRTVL